MSDKIKKLYTEDSDEVVGITNGELISIRCSKKNIIGEIDEVISHVANASKKNHLINDSIEFYLNQILMSLSEAFLPKMRNGEIGFPVVPKNKKTCDIVFTFNVNIKTGELSEFKILKNILL